MIKLLKVRRRVMLKSIVSGIMCATLLVCVLILAFNIQPVKTESTTIIVPDDYLTIQEAINNANEGDTVFVKAGIYYENVILNKSISLIGEERDTTIVDGGSYANCVYISSNDVDLRGFTFRNGGYAAVFVQGVQEVLIKGNIVLDSYYGISALDCFGNIVEENVVKYCEVGIYVQSGCQQHLIVMNSIMDNAEGIVLLWFWPPPIYPWYTDHIVYHNNFKDNTLQAQDYGLGDLWDGGYPSGGNYWSDYAGNDTYSGHYQNETGSDGIGDTSYVIDGWPFGGDRYPLMNAWGVVANFTWTPSIPKVGEYVTFDASSSTSDIAEIVRYEWSFGDGYGYGSSKIVSHAYTSSDNYTVTLTVRDSEGLRGREQKQIQVVIGAIGGYSFPIKGYTTERLLTVYLALVAILTLSFTTIKRKTHRKTKRF